MLDRSEPGQAAAAARQYARAVQQYARMAIETAPTGRLIALAYQAALRAVRAAMGALAAEPRTPAALEAAHNQLMRAQALLGELRAGLNFAGPGAELAAQLDSLYDYLLNRLVESNLRKDPAPAQEVERLLAVLTPAWEAAARAQPPAEPSPSQPPGRRGPLAELLKGG